VGEAQGGRGIRAGGDVEDRLIAGGGGGGAAGSFGAFSDITSRWSEDWLDRLEVYKLESRFLRSVDLPDNGRTIESALCPTASACSFTFFLQRRRRWRPRPRQRCPESQNLTRGVCQRHHRASCSVRWSREVRFRPARPLAAPPCRRVLGAPAARWVLGDPRPAPSLHTNAE
jgi:hypothetical protein